MKVQNNQPKADRQMWHAGGGLLRVGLLAVAGFAACVTSVQAQDADPAQVAAPWLPDVVQAADPYYAQLGLDHFGGPNSADEVGGLTAQMSNGDRVVAGLVPNYLSVGTCNNGVALCNIGLVRYDQAGNRRAWTNPGMYGHFGDNYVIYPGFNNPTFEFIRDIKVLNDIIYVLVDERLSQTGLGRQNVTIAAFRGDGSFIKTLPVFGFTFINPDSEDFYGAQMVFMTNNQMIVTATAYDGTTSYLTVNRLAVAGDGNFSQDIQWGSWYGGGNSNRLMRYPLSASVAYTAGYAVNPVGSNFLDFYVGGSFHVGGTDWDPIVLKISSQSGALKTEFGGYGYVVPPFDDTASTKTDMMAGLYVYQDDVYLAAQVARKCHNGIGLAKLNGSTGQYITAFGGDGKVVFGGQGDAPFCIDGDNRDVPYALSATGGGRLGVVGYGATSVSVGGGTQIDPMLAVVNAVNGSVLDFARHPILRTDGSRAGDGVLFSVYGGPNPTSPFTVAGNGRDTNAGNTLSYLSGKLTPISVDRIFANNFGIGDD